MKFSAFDVLDGTELDRIDSISFDGILYNDLGEPEFDSTTGRYVYTINVETYRKTSMRITKNTYFPFIGKYFLENVTSIDDLWYREHPLDLGRIGLLNEVKEDAIILLWEERPNDLDIRLVCPNGEAIGVDEPTASTTAESYLSAKNENYFAKMSVDSKLGYGPETVVINHWSDFNSKYKIGGKWKFLVKWYAD